MDKRVVFFKNIIANSVLTVVVVVILIFSLTDNTVQASVPQKPVYKGNSTTSVSLMFNVYWGTEHIDSILQVLENNNVKTTFFVGGMWAAENDVMLKKIFNAGHEIGNNGYFHKDHKKLTAERNKEEINVTHQLVRSIIGVEMNLFAPPSGSFSNLTLQAAESLNYKTILYTFDSFDWRDKDANLIFENSTSNLAGGNLILMHPTAETAQALDKIIKTIKAQNLTVEPVSAVLNQ